MFAAGRLTYLPTSSLPKRSIESYHRVHKVARRLTLLAKGCEMERQSQDPHLPPSFFNLWKVDAHTSTGKEQGEPFPNGICPRHISHPCVQEGQDPRGTYREGEQAEPCARGVPVALLRDTQRE